jgi:hypothetical protein
VQSFLAYFMLCLLLMKRMQLQKAGQKRGKVKNIFFYGVRSPFIHCTKFWGCLLTAIAMLVTTGYAASQPTLQENSADLAFVNVNVVPMDQDRILERYTVLIKDDLITWLGPANSIELPAALRKIDGTDKYLMSGLVDSHVHLEFNAGRHLGVRMHSLRVSDREEGV